MTARIEFSNAPIVRPARQSAAREIGACVEFLGIVREMENNRPITGLLYEAYEPMAHIVLEQILAELGAKYPCDEILVIHRLGFVPVGEASLFMRVQSRHRSECLEMISNAIDRLKSDVPIWKRV
jgi:molybdopterin synthase catalytic subunit